ncbi:MAG: hypothetical protein JSU00_25435 [Acidobacteria bacterium]|nr:hypothetical protein [Acidobacteriota bacterium]
MSFSVNTNITSLQAQDTLRMTSDFQSKTINRVTSGLRIVSSGDDAAGLAIANGLRSDQAVLSQGVRNANDGLSTLQTIDGGMSNISKLLDRARTLATQSASGTFTGDRNVLNSEFQSVMSEINRQAQAIGMNSDGQFAKSLSVFVGGGKGADSSAALSNGAIGLDLSTSTVDAKSLGLDSYRAANTGYDLGSSSATSVSKIIANEGSGVDTAVFKFRGAGFGDSSSEVAVTISTQGITDTAGLATAINKAIYDAGNPTTSTSATTAFKNAGITASIVTDSSGKQQLAFSSASAAFQVHGDQLANAFMGYVADSRVGMVTGEGSTYVQGGSTMTSVSSDLSAATLAFTYGGSTHTVTLNHGSNSLNGSTTPISTQDAVDKINGDMTTDGVTSIRAELKDGRLSFYSTTGAEFNVAVTGDHANALGMIDATNPRSALSAEGSVVSLTPTLATDFSTTHLTFKDGSGSAITGLSDVTLSANNPADVATLVTSLNTTLDTAVGGTSKIRAEANGTTGIRFYSTDNSAFSVAGWDTAVVNGSGGGEVALLGAGTASSDGTSANPGAAKYSAYTSKESEYQALTSGGVYQSAQEASTGTYTDYSKSAYDFTAVAAGNSQTITINTKGSDGTIKNLDITLNNSNGSTVGKAVDALNQALQQSLDDSLKGITALRDENGIRFVSTNAFSVTLGSASGTNAGYQGLSEVTNGGQKQNSVQLAATEQGQSGLADISNQSSAQNAVAALATAVQTLGQAQAVVGRGQNQLNYAINLAQSQMSNMAAAESRIRDADLANEAANLTKAQILMQAGVAALAQANSAPQQILSLLKG